MHRDDKSSIFVVGISVQDLKFYTYIKSRHIVFYTLFRGDGKRTFSNVTSLFVHTDEPLPV